MKNFRVKWVALILLAGTVSCRPDEIVRLEPGGEQPSPEPGRPDVPVVEKLAKIEVVTDGGVAVDSKDSKDSRPCTVTVKWLFDIARILNARGKIRGRGNSTWNWYPKKPYRIKLDESATMVGLPANKDWVLLADYRDITHMMYAVGFWLARELGLPCANHIRWVTLSLNGEDMGLYALTELVEEGGNRVPLDTPRIIPAEMEIRDETFAGDALMFEEGQVMTAELLDKQRQPVLKVRCDQAEAFGIWAPKKEHCPFVCLEPWCVICDPKGFTGDISERPYAHHLAPGEQFAFRYEVEVL